MNTAAQALSRRLAALGTSGAFAIADVIAGRDAVLEEGLRLILGPKTPISEIVRNGRSDNRRVRHQP